jgi:hypothetical protein
VQHQILYQSGYYWFCNKIPIDDGIRLKKGCHWCFMTMTTVENLVIVANMNYTLNEGSIASETTFPPSPSERGSGGEVF